MTTTRLSGELARYHGRNHSVMVGSGTTALYCILKSLGLNNANIGIPNNVCMNVILAVLYSGNIPVYLDIDAQNHGLSVEAVKRSKTHISALLAVHAYGFPCDIRQLEQYCKENDIILVEDVAVAQGVRAPEGIAGSFGTASILSFGAGKIIDVGHGGAVLCNDDILRNDIERIASSLGVFTQKKKSDIASLNMTYKILYNNHYGRDLIKQADTFADFALSLKESHLYQFDTQYTETIKDHFSNLENNIRNRKKKANYFQTMLMHEGYAVLPTQEGAVPWRYILLVEQPLRDRILKFFLEKKTKISSWYPPISQFFDKNYNAQELTPVCVRSGEMILNFWVNDEVDNDYYENILLGLQTLTNKRGAACS